MAHTIKSRPQYPGLKPFADARRHLIAAEGEGADAVLRLFANGGPDFASRAHVVYAATGPNAARHTLRLRSLQPDAIDLADNADAALARLAALLSEATMGTRLYVAGTEGFVGRVLSLAIDHGIDHHSVATEHKGSLARRVQCVHCKGFTEEVRTSIFECGHCGLLLFVRDHYSRRLAAFQGVAVNAEDPGSRPTPEEIYP